MRLRWIVAALGLVTSGALAQTSSGLPTGVWENKAYGAVIEAGDRITVYDISAAGCVEAQKFRDKDFAGFVGRVESATADSAVLVQYPTRMTLTRLPALPQACRHPLKTKDAAVNLTVFSQTFTELYPFFAERRTDWAALKAKAATDSDLFDALSGMATALNDGHVTLSSDDRDYIDASVVAPGKAPDGSAWTTPKLAANFRDYLQASRFGGQAMIVANRKALYGKLPGNIGYIAILGEGNWRDGIKEAPGADHVAATAEVLDKILADLNGVRGLIIDLRVNTGGHDAVALEIASRFADQARLIFRKAAGKAAPYDVTITPSSRQRFVGPVAVLTSRNTVSAGETLALAMKAFPQVRLIGQPTRGILSDAIPKTLPNGWSYSLSIESYFTPAGDLVEVKGVEPHEVITPTADHLWDGEIDAALAWLKAQP